MDPAALRFDRFLNLLGYLRMQWAPDEGRRREIEEMLNLPTLVEAEAAAASRPAYDDPWHVPGLKVPAWAETETRM